MLPAAHEPTLLPAHAAGAYRRPFLSFFTHFPPILTSLAHPCALLQLIPFAELALPLLLKLFPNLLPSTFQDQLKQEARVHRSTPAPPRFCRERGIALCCASLRQFSQPHLSLLQPPPQNSQETMKQQLKARIEMAKFLQETTESMAGQLAKSRSGAVQATAAELYDFMRRVRTGAPVSNDDIKKFAKLFNDELTLDTVDRMQLVNMCKFVGIAPYGTDTFLRYQLRKKLRDIRQDDRMIADEGVSSLTYDELRSACRIRGMRWDGETTANMQRQLEDWLELSMNAQLPSSLLILSRAFTITHLRLEDSDTTAVKDIRDTLASLPDEAFGKVEVETCVEEDSAEQKQRKLELLQHEDEMIREEECDRREAAQNEGEALQIDSGAGRAAAQADEHATSKLTSVAEVEEISEQERKQAHAKERRRMARKVARAIATLAGSSSVLPERREFQDLVKKELERYDSILHEPSKAAQVALAVSSDPAAARLSTRVNNMLGSLEKELNKVDASIGPKLHKLDLNKDGVLDSMELDAASLLLKDFMGATGCDDVRDILGDVMDAQGRVKVQALLQLALEEDPDEAPVRLDPTAPFFNPVLLASAPAVGGLCGGGAALSVRQTLSALCACVVRASAAPPSLRIVLCQLSHSLRSFYFCFAPQFAQDQQNSGS